MIFLHFLLGLLLGKLFGYTLLFLFASLLPDIDHLYIIAKHRLFSKKKLIAALKHEERRGIRFKTPFIHSLFGLLICSFVFYLLFAEISLTLFFSLAYFSHLLLDWPDIDKKLYLWPLSKREFSGFLQIWSKTEQAITLLTLIILVYLYIA